MANLPTPQPPPVLIATLFSDIDLAALLRDAEQTRVVYSYDGDPLQHPADLSAVPEFNALCVSLPAGLLEQYQRFELALRFIEARRPWTFTLSSGEPISQGFAERVAIETEGMGYEVMMGEGEEMVGAASGGGCYAVMGVRQK